MYQFQTTFAQGWIGRGIKSILVDLIVNNKEENS
jgi:hypothetical protein